MSVEHPLKERWLVLQGSVALPLPNLQPDAVVASLDRVVFRDEAASAQSRTQILDALAHRRVQGRVRRIDCSKPTDG